MGQNWYFVNILEQDIEFVKCLVFKKKFSSETDGNEKITGILLEEMIQKWLFTHKDN